MDIKTILQNELKLLARDKKAIFLSLALSLAFIYLFILAFSPYYFQPRYATPFAIAIVNKDKALAAKMAVNQFESLDYVRELVKIYAVEDKEARQLLKDNKVSGVVILPAGFADSIYVGQNKSLVYIGNPKQRATSDLLKNQLLAAVNLISAGQAGIITVWNYAKDGGAGPELLDRLYNETVYKFTMGSLGRSGLFAEKTVAAIPKVTPAEYFTAALITVFATFLGSRGTKSMFAEQEPGLKARLSSTPLGVGALIGGKLCSGFLYILLQLVLILILAHYTFNIYLGHTWIKLFLFLAALSFTVASWSLLLAAVSHSPQAADLLGYGGNLLLAIVGGAIYPLVAMPDIIRSLSRFTYYKWAISGFLQVFSGKITGDLRPEILALTGMGLFFAALSTAVFAFNWRK